jgi:hypothetical protein
MLKYNAQEKIVDNCEVAFGDIKTSEKVKRCI